MNKLISSGTAALAAIVFIALIASAQEPDRRPTLSPEQKAAMDRGRLQFQQVCGFCHGPDATGARGPDLVRSPLVAHDVRGELIGEVIRTGRPDKGMPALPLTAEQISDVTAFLHARSKEALESSSVPAAYPAEKLLTGNAEKGKAFFEGAGGCKNCHAPRGDLAGVAHKYSPTELQANMLYPVNKPVTAVITLADGQRLFGIVSHMDDFTIGIRIGDKDGWYRSFARTKVKVELNDPLAEHRQLLNKLTSADMHDLFTYLYTLK